MIKSVLEFGACGDGVQDDYEAIQAALDSGAREIVIPQGVYPVSGTLRVHSGTTIRADASAKIIMRSSHRRKRNDFLLTNDTSEKPSTDITILGGIWDGNNTAPENAKPDLFDETGYSGCVLNFDGVNGLTLRSMVIANSVTFYVRMCRLHRFVIEDISFVSDRFGVNQDGLHFGGDVKHGTVKNIRALSYGQTNDDMIALNADDCITRVENLDLCRAAIEDITFENIFTENCHTIIRMLSVTAPIQNIRFRNVFGGFRCNAINADAARYCRTPLFREEEYPHGVGAIRDVTIENFTCFPIAVLPADFQGTQSQPPAALRLESHADHFRIRGFHYRDDTRHCPALMVRNLTDTAVNADGTAHLVSKKEDVLMLDTFESIAIDKVTKS